MARLLTLAVTFWFWASLSLAQEIDFDDFNRFASSVESSLESDVLSDGGLETLRASLADWREEMLAGQNVNEVQIDALDAQLSALGTAPTDGSDEDASLAARRKELQESLQTARAPQISAIEGYARADSLIRQIDAVLRSRQTNALLELGRTPLDPSLWQPAIGRLVSLFSAARSEVETSLGQIASRSELAQRLILAVILLAIAVFLLFRAPRFVERVLERIENSPNAHATVVYGFVVSLLGVVVAMAAISLINAALISTGILGTVGRAHAIGINAAILAYAVGRWLGGRVFPERSAIPTVLNLDDRSRASGRRNASGLGVLAGLLSLLGIVNQTAKIEPESLAVLTFPILVLMGISLFRLGTLAVKGSVPAEDETATFSNGVVSLFGRVVQGVAIIGPVLAVIGFGNLAKGILWPLTLSLALIAVLLSVHYVLRAGYALLRGLDEDQAKQALTPVLVSLLLTLAALPIFALLWGARDSDLNEVWSQFKTGIRLGDVSISPGSILTLLIVFAIGFGLTRLIQGTLRSSVMPRTNFDKGGQNAVVSGVGYVGITLAALVAITSAGLNLSSFAIVLGALGVGIGFGLQNIVNNFVSGIILLIERPIGEGDWVEVNGQMGIVKAISVRSTRIETFDRTDVIVPNGDLISGTVTNWTRGNSVGRIIVPVGVAYGTDTRKVEAILQEIAEAHPIVSISPPPFIVFKGFGADSLDFEIRAILTDINFGLSARSDINHEIAKRFAAEGIEIPFAQRDIWLRNPEALSAAN